MLQVWAHSEQYTGCGGSPGLETRQLAPDITYPQTDRNANQLVTLHAINVLTPRTPIRQRYSTALQDTHRRETDPRLDKLARELQLNVRVCREAPYVHCGS